jgi:hypothetical protein
MNVRAYACKSLEIIVPVNVPSTLLYLCFPGHLHLIFVYELNDPFKKENLATMIDTFYGVLLAIDFSKVNLCSAIYDVHTTFTLMLDHILVFKYYTQMVVVWFFFFRNPKNVVSTVTSGFFQIWEHLVTYTGDKSLGRVCNRLQKFW